MERLARLQALQREVSRERMGAELGRTVEVLVEGPSDGGPGLVMGRTPENRVVHVSAGGSGAGDLVRVRITRTGGNSLGGELAA